MIEIFSNIYLWLWVIICIWLFGHYFRKGKVGFRLIKIILIFWIIITFLNLFLNKLFLFLQFKKDSILHYLLPPYSDYIFINTKRDLIEIYTTIFISLLIGLIFSLITKKARGKF